MKGFAVDVNAGRGIAFVNNRVAKTIKNATPSGNDGAALNLFLFLTVISTDE